MANNFMDNEFVKIPFSSITVTHPPSPSLYLSVCLPGTTAADGGREHAAEASR